MSILDDFRKDAPSSAEATREMIEALEREGFRVSKAPPIERASAQLVLPLSAGGKLKVGIVSDTHIGSKYQQITALRDFYAYADSQGVQAFLHAGDMLEGIHQAHRDAAYEQYVHGVDAQIDAVVAQYPRSQNGPTYFVDGNHDDWAFQQVGTTSGRWIASLREDLLYMGYHSAFLTLNDQIRFLLQHGSRGGGTYAKSYKIQRLIEQLSETERVETDIALFGHWHQDLYLGHYMGTFTFMLPCFKAQDRFLRSLGRNPTIGGLLLEIEFTRDREVWNLTQTWRTYEPTLDDYPGAGL